MDHNVPVSLIAQRQSPVLTRTGFLVRSLSMCMLYATTPQAANIPVKIDDESDHSDGPQGYVAQRGYRNSDLATELDRIAGDGFDVFKEANGFLNGIKNTAGFISRPGGPLETLQSDFGIPEASRANKRILNDLNREVGECTSRGKQLACRLGEWNDQTKILKQALLVEQVSGARTQQQVQRQLTDRHTEVQIAVARAQDSEDAAAAAQEKHKRNLEASRKQTFSWSDLHVPQSHNLMQYLLCAGSAAKTTYLWYTSRTAASIVEDTEREFSRKQADADRCRRELKSAEASLLTLNAKNLQMDEYAKALSATLNALGILAREVSSMLTEFGEMDSLMRDLTRRYEHGLDKVASEPGETNAYDIKEFSMHALQMREWSIKVEHLAWLYAETIRQVMVQGFQDIRSTPRTSNSDGQGAPLLICMSEDDGISTCSTIFSQVDQSFRGSCERLVQPTNFSTPNASLRNSRTPPAIESKKRSLFRRSRGSASSRPN